jgi:hypothetical protein
VRRWLFILLAVLALIAVLYVFISPAVDLDPVTTRAWQIALLLLCGLAYWGRLLTQGCKPACELRTVLPCLADAVPLYPPPELALLCSRTC